MQKPNMAPDIRNLWPRRRLRWKIVMWATAPRRKMRRKTAVTGTSREMVGWPPRPAVVDP